MSEISKYNLPWCDDPEIDRQRKLNALSKEEAKMTGISSQLSGYTIEQAFYVKESD